MLVFWTPRYLTYSNEVFGMNLFIAKCQTLHRSLHRTPSKITTKHKRQKCKLFLNVNDFFYQHRSELFVFFFKIREKLLLIRTENVFKFRNSLAHVGSVSVETANNLYSQSENIHWNQIKYNFNMKSKSFPKISLRSMNQRQLLQQFIPTRNCTARIVKFPKKFV